MDEPTLSTADGEVKLADFDLDAWIDGTTGITGVARIVQRGDLLATRDRLERELETVKRMPAEDRAVGDRTPESVEAELERCYEQLWQSMLWVHVQDRTQDRRHRIAQALKDDGVDDTETIGWHVVADSIVKVETADGRQVPLGEDGFGAQRLLAIRDRVGDAGLIDLRRVYGEVTSQAPAVRAPLSRGPSSTPGGTTSRSGSGRRRNGASRR